MQRIPWELITEIVEYCSSWELANLLRVNRRMYEITLPLLYTHPTDGIFNAKSLKKFIKTILTVERGSVMDVPDGRKFIRSLDFSHLSFSHRNRVDYVNDLVMNSVTLVFDQLEILIMPPYYPHLHRMFQAIMDKFNNINSFRLKELHLVECDVNSVGYGDPGLFAKAFCYKLCRNVTLIDFTEFGPYLNCILITFSTVIKECGGYEIIYRDARALVEWAVHSDSDMPPVISRPSTPVFRFPLETLILNGSEVKELEIISLLVSPQCPRLEWVEVQRCTNLVISDSAIIKLLRARKILYPDFAVVTIVTTDNTFTTPSSKV